MKKIEQQKTYVIDATDQILGRLATRVAGILRGKIKPTFVTNKDTGDCVVVINASKIKVTGKKLQDKKYYHYSGYPGGMSEKTLGVAMKKDPAWVIKIAVKGMLPKNKLQNIFLKKLAIFADDSYQIKEGEIKL